MHKLHETFIALAAQLHEIHEAVKVKAWLRYKATSYNLGQNCLENCILGEHFPKHPSCIDSSHSPSPREAMLCVQKKPDS